MYNFLYVSNCRDATNTKKLNDGSWFEILIWKNHAQIARAGCCLQLLSNLIAQETIIAVDWIIWCLLHFNFYAVVIMKMAESMTVDWKKKLSKHGAHRCLLFLWNNNT